MVNPHTFLTTEAFNTRRFRALLPDTRPMDNVALSFDAPQEDEFAPTLACFRSLYPGISFPRNVAHYERYLTFRGVPRPQGRDHPPGPPWRVDDAGILVIQGFPAPG